MERVQAYTQNALYKFGEEKESKGIIILSDNLSVFFDKITHIVSSIEEAPNGFYLEDAGISWPNCLHVPESINKRMHYTVMEMLNGYVDYDVVPDPPKKKVTEQKPQQEENYASANKIFKDCLTNKHSYGAWSR